MRVWRSCKKARIHDLSETGAKIHGGRWNPVGIAVVYTSESHSLSILESLVHFTMDNSPQDYFLVEIEIPDHLKIQKIEMNGLPVDWKNYPGPDKLKEIGKQWAQALHTLILSVPSVVDIYGKNFLLNPLHPDFNKIRIVRSLPFDIDNRLLRLERRRKFRKSLASSKRATGGMSLVTYRKSRKV